MQKPEGFRCNTPMHCLAKQPFNKVTVLIINITIVIIIYYCYIYLSSLLCYIIAHKLLVNDLSVNFDKIIIYLHVINSIFLPSRYYKNSIPQQSGLNKDVIDWCRKEAERLKLKSEDYWGGLIFDEMKIQVKICYF